MKAKPGRGRSILLMQGPILGMLPAIPTVLCRSGCRVPGGLWRNKGVDVWHSQSYASQFLSRSCHQWEFMAPGTPHPNLWSTAGAQGWWQLLSPPGKCSDSHRAGPHAPFPPGLSPVGYWHRLQTLKDFFLFHGWTQSSWIDPADSSPFFYSLYILAKCFK